MRLISVMFVLLCCLPARATEPIDFARDIRPILARHCFKCHGPDDKTRKGKLRLDQREAALAESRSGLRAIVPGQIEESELVARIRSEEPGTVMPPPAAQLALNETQRRLLERWIKDGAEYRPHWAFVTPRLATLPPVRERGWPRNPIDSFILARLEAAGLRPSPQADRYTLVRRIYLDLLGLPPTQAEAAAFVSDPAPDAWERLVDRLLASPHYGERWARRWLDLARYADTNGYEKDRPRSIWPYRDWVIDALNADMPFDQFTVEQLAGDLLPNATLSQQIATGFHRNTMLNEEGGIDPLEFRFHAMTDRVNTTATTWLGLTLGCAQCHSHKYDPITHREYYQVLAFLNNADEPEIDLPSRDGTKAREKLLHQIDRLEAGLSRTLSAEQESRLQGWLAEQRVYARSWTTLHPARATSNLPLLTVLPDHSVLASGDQSKRDVYELQLPVGKKRVTGIRLEVLPDARLPKHGPGRVSYEGPFGDFFLSEFVIRADGKPCRIARGTHTYANKQHTAAAAIDGDPQTGWSIDGGQGKPHMATFQLETPIEVADVLQLEMIFERYYAAGLGRFRVAVTGDAGPIETRGLPATLEELVRREFSELSSEERDAIRRHYCLTAPELAERRKPIDELRRQVPVLPTTLVMRERLPDNPRPTHLHHRGEYLQPRERVEPDGLGMLPPLPAHQPKNRLTLARWLVQPDNPLVGRVTMNRHWQAFFGRGLVRTLEDFGLQGELPTHPELLDWLAIEFVRRGWSIKQMHRLMVTSATYQQSSMVTPELLRRDPSNQLLARGPRLRLEAELIRDSALRVAGLLSPRFGGPSVFPPQPPSITSEGTYGAFPWKASEGPHRYRRSLYTFTKRTAPFALYNTFDAPSGEACVARRDSSNTPLQALSLLNDRVFVEASQSLGRRMAEQAGTTSERLADLFQASVTRPPLAQELELLECFYREQLGRLERNELNPALVVGLSGASVEQAAWTLVARAILNLDEVITRN